MRAIPGELRKVIFPALCGIALALTALLLGSYLDRFIQPKLESAESPRITLALPTKLLTDGRAVALSLVAPKYFGTELMIQSSGCLIAIELNGVPLQPVAAQSPCLENAPWGSTFDAQGTIQVGANRLKLTFADGVTSAVLNLAIASWDRRLVSVRVGALVLLTMAWWLLAKGFSLSGERHLAWWVFYLAALLRITYFWSTPPWLRAYDFSWHFNYIRHVANHWNIPSAANDPMFYHPPLAYFFAAVPYRLGVMFDLSFAELARLVQVGSFVCSLLIFITCFAACYLVSLSSRLRVLGGVFWATTPALILPGLRVNNDLLAQFFQFLVVALALLWWREPRFRSWCGVAVALSAGILSKTSTLLLAPLLILLPLLRHELSLSQRMRYLASAVVLVGLLTGWYFVYRAAVDQRVAYEGNMQVLDPRLLIADGWSGLLTFSPQKMLELPYNHSRDHFYRRDNFWEYYFRSAFFGEFRFPEQVRLPAQLILAGGMLIMLLACLNGRRNLPLLLVMAGGLLGHLVYRVKFPSSSGQDFRYTSFVLLPFVLSALEAIEHRQPNLRRLGISLFAIGLVASGIFSLWICFLPYPIWGGW